MTSPHKLHIKIGHVEFNAEGSEATVNSQYQKFIEVIKAVGFPPGSPPSTPASDAGDNGKNGEQPQGLLTVQEPPPDSALLNKAFLHQDDSVSLRVLPSTDHKEADATLMILYGFKVLKGKTDVSASDLLEAAKQSGLGLARLDKVLTGYTAYFRKGGQRKGSRYGLTNPGIAHAEKLLRELFG